MEDNFNIYRLNLYSDPAYSYHVVLEARSYRMSFKYNTRMQKWIMNIGYSNGDDIVNGKVIYPNYPLLVNQIPTLSGYFMLLPIGEYENETISNPYEIYKYYRLYYAEDRSFENPDY